MITEKMLDRAMEILIDRENQAAKARAAAEHMGDLTKVVLAKLMGDAPPDLKSATARETWALAHPQYTAHLEQKKPLRRWTTLRGISGRRLRLSSRLGAPNLQTLGQRGK
jgi:HD superfamily phosphohydrolase